VSAPIAASDSGTAENVAAGTEPGLGALWQQLSRIVHDWIELIALESRLAGLSVAAMLALGVLSGLMFASAWLLVAGSAVSWLHASSGYSWSSLLLAAAVVNLLLGVVLALSIGRLSRHLLFPAMRRSLAGRGSSPERTDVRTSEA
jgi:hypothetical protein